MEKLKANKEFGKTGLSVPPIIYGTSYLGNLYADIGKAAKLEIVKKWFECTEKPVVIDSAGKYGAGLALEMIGELLDELNIDPDDVIISNKLAWYRVPLTSDEPTFEPGAWANLKYDAVQRISYQGILDCYEQGNNLLGGKYKTSLVSVHDPDEYLNTAKSESEKEDKLNDIYEAYKALFELKEKGEIKGIGVGSKDWKIIKDLSQSLNFDWVMFANKFTIYHHPLEMLEFIDTLHNNGVGIVNSAVFNAGFLTGGQFFDYVKIDQDDPKYKHLFLWRDKFHAICDQFKVKPSDACIQFGISHPAIAGIALNTSKPEKMPANVNIIQKVFPTEFWKTLKNEGIIDPGYKYL
ncbi:MAG: aldo/keto reductase [Bacteroidales bacterium]|nr:aldo/keto reductase [Bacteroidales bacterium]